MLSELPSLLDIIEQLQPYSKSSGKSPGKFALHDETDYIDLGFYVSILAVAVSNIREYVVQERRAKHTVASHQSSPSIGGERPKTDLQLLHTALEALHSKIGQYFQLPPSHRRLKVVYPISRHKSNTSGAL